LSISDEYFGFDFSKSSNRRKYKTGLFRENKKKKLMDDLSQFLPIPN